MRWFGRRGLRARTSGYPPSPNGASSFHLHWRFEADPGPLVAAHATLEVLDEPDVARTYFWALQASFEGEGGRRFGGGHTGLQWYPPHPRSRAVNWGGYGRNGGVLPGTDSPLPSATDDPNTRDYPWEAGRPYRFTIQRGDVGWQAAVTDALSGEATVVRELLAGGDRLTGLVVWSEVFARCDDPRVRVRWADLGGRTAAGETVSAVAVVTAYQSHAAGGCANTDSTLGAEGTGVLQVTNTPRTTPPGAVLPVRRS